MTVADFEALSFDCYGTLIDWEAGIAAVLTPWAADHGVALTTEQLLERYATAEAQEEERTPAARYPSILGAAMASLGKALGVHVTDAERERLATSVPDWPAFPDSAEALDELSRRYKLIILSNVDRTSFAGSNAFHGGAGRGRSRCGQHCLKQWGSGGMPPGDGTPPRKPRLRWLDQDQRQFSG